MLLESFIFYRAILNYVTPNERDDPTIRFELSSIHNQELYTTINIYYTRNTHNKKIFNIKNLLQNIKSFFLINLDLKKEVLYYNICCTDVSATNFYFLEAFAHNETP